MQLEFIADVLCDGIVTEKSRCKLKVQKVCAGWTVGIGASALVVL